MLIALSANAQTNAIDSLENKLLLHRAKDTTRVNLLNEIAFLYHRKDITKTVEYVAESEKLAKKLNFKKGEAKSIYLKGITQVIQSDLDDALRCFNEALEMYEIIDFDEGISKCYNGIGIVHYYQGDYQKSLTYYKKSLYIDEKSGDKNRIAASLNNLGSTYSDIGEYDKGIDYYKRALKINREIKDDEGISGCLNNLGTIYEDLGNFPLALESYSRSLVISEKIGDSIGISFNLNNIGIIYRQLEKYDKALVYYKRSLAMHKKTGDAKNISKVLINIGIIHEHKKAYSLALESSMEALKLSRSIDYSDQISICLNNIGQIYFDLEEYQLSLKYYEEAKEINIEIEDPLGLCNSYLGIASVYVGQKKYSVALTSALKSLELSEKHGLMDFERDAHQLLSEIYGNTGRYKEAFSSHQRFKVLNDSIFNKANIEKITQLEYEYKYQGQLESANNRELKLTEKVKSTTSNLEKTQQNLLLGVIAFLALLLILGAIIFFLKLRNVKSKNQNIVIEQKLLRSQMTPHFIFNSLSVLQGMILNREDKKAVSYLSKFSKLLRITLENSRDKTVSLNQELIAVENYLKLQNIEENKSYEYRVIVDDSIDRSIFNIPPMLIQPFIENAVEHGFENDQETRKIDVHLNYLNKKLICTITDNGMGINFQRENKIQDKKSLATTITSERLNILSKDFNMEGSIALEDRQKDEQRGTVVTLVIPYKIDRNI